MAIGIQPILGDVRVQDPHTNVVDAYFAREISQTTLVSQALVNTSTCTVDTGHGFVIGDILVIRGIYQGLVKNVVGDVITVNQPFNMTFPIGTVIDRGSYDMNVNGSVTPVIFKFLTAENIRFDIYSFKLAMRGSADMDDAKFGSLTALTNGVMVRVKKSDIRYNNLFNVTSNSEFHLRGTLSYNAKAPSGEFGMDFEYSFRDNKGVAVRIDDGQEIQIIVNDDLTGLLYMRATAQGHVVEGL